MWPGSRMRSRRSASRSCSRFRCVWRCVRPCDCPSPSASNSGESARRTMIPTQRPPSAAADLFVIPGSRKAIGYPFAPRKDAKKQHTVHNCSLRQCDRGRTMSKQRISYVPLDKMTPEMRAEMERCAREGTPRPESSAVRAHVPGAFWSFANSWRDIFHTGVCDHAIKELCRLYVSRSVKCEFCGNQRSIKAFTGKLEEAQADDLVNFEKSVKYN